MLNRRKVGTTSSPHGLYAQGYTRATMGGIKGSDAARCSKSQKTVLSSDRSLQLDSVKLESLVIVDQHATVNTFPGPYTPPVTPRKSAVPEVAGLTPLAGEQAPKVRSVIGVKS